MSWISNVAVSAALRCKWADYILGCKFMEQYYLKPLSDT